MAYTCILDATGVNAKFQGVADVFVSNDGSKFQPATRVRSDRTGKFVFFARTGQYVRMVVTSDGQFTSAFSGGLGIPERYVAVDFGAPGADGSTTTKALGGKVTYTDPEVSATTGGSGGGVGASNVFMVVKNGSVFSSTPAQVDAARAAGALIQWIGGTPVYADGGRNGDIAGTSILSGIVTPAGPTTVTLAAGQFPTAQDGYGTASDTVTLTKVTGVTWIVNGVSHPSSAMAGATKVVPVTTGSTALVTATADSGYVLSGTTTWSLTLTNVAQPGPTPLTVAYVGSAWDKTPTQISTARAGGSTVSWAGTTVLPKPADGLAEGDAVSGTFAQPSPAAPLAKVSIPNWAVPTVVDGDQTSDTVQIKKYQGLTYTVDGVARSSDAMASSTEQVPTGGKSSVPVSVDVTKPARFQILEPTKAWTLNFNTTDTWITGALTAPVANDQGNTVDDTVTVTSVPGVIWTVDGVDHPSSGFTGTKVIPYTKGVNTTVTARADAGYQFAAGVTASWNLLFTSVAAGMGVLTSSDFANYANGATFNENSGAGVPFTMNNYDGGTQTAASAKYCQIASGGLLLQNSGSYFSHVAPAVTGSVTMEWTHVGRGGTGDSYMFPMYKGATGLGWGARVTATGLLGGAKITNWTVGNQGYTSGAATAVAAGDRVKLVATSTSMTAFINDVQVWAYGYVSMTDNSSAQLMIGTISGTNYSLDNYKFSRA